MFGESISYVFREVCLLKWPVTINKFVLSNKTTAQDRMYVGLSSNWLSHAYNYHGVMADEWLRGGARVDTLLQQISAMLNSNEQFEMDDSFQLLHAHARLRWVPVANTSWKPAIPPWHPSRKRSCLCSSLRTETIFVAPEPSSLPKPELTNTPTGTGSKEAEGSKQNMQ